MAAAVPVVSVADPETNADRICALIDKAVDKSVSMILFPHSCITGSTCGDLILQDRLQESAENALEKICKFTEGLPITVIVGASVNLSGQITYCNYIINDGDIVSAVPEGEYESFSINGAVFSFNDSDRAQIILHPASEGEDMFRSEARKRIIAAQTENSHSAYIFCNAGFGESTTDYVFSGASLIYEDGKLLAEGKEFSHKAELTIADIDVHALDHLRIRESNDYDPAQEGDLAPIVIDNFPETEFDKHLYRPVNGMPFIPETDDGFRKAFQIQCNGLYSRMTAIRCSKAVIGISGGLDSTLALLCAVRTFEDSNWDKRNIIGITMPGFGTSRRTHDNASELMEELGITNREIDITASCVQHLKDIGHDGTTQDTAFENAQARERTQILMDVANMENAIVVGTGDLSELALGWCTYNGDHMSNYAVNASIPKTLVRAMVGWIADNIYHGSRTSSILKDIIATPVSPELTGKGGDITQITEDIVGPYELHDFFIYNMMVYGFSPEKILFLSNKAFEGKYSDEEIRKWMKLFIKRFFTQQFKRSCCPDGPQVSQVSLSPRGAWEMPSDIGGTLWRENL